MALKVWLPLNGDLRNNGIGNVIVTNNGATVDSAGKIGSCYYFNGSSHIRISLPTDMTTILGCTIAAWVKSESSTLALGGISQDVSNYSLPCVTLYSSGWQFTSTARGGYGYVNGGTVANTNVWHHVACTIDTSGNIQTYLDGAKVASSSLTTLNVAANTILTSNNFIEIGCDHPGGDEFLTGRVNDFRVYDHCLSAAEVKKISQGLILHLSLDEYQNINLLSGNISQISAWTSENATRILDTSEQNSIKVTLSSSGGRIYNNVSNVWIVDNDTYTVSFYAKGQTNGQKIRFSRSVGSYFPTVTLTNSWQYYTITGSISGTSTGGTLSIQGSGNASNEVFWIRDVKLEKGTIATNFLLPGQTPIQNLGIFDKSGYCHNGSILNGPLTPMASSPRYKLAMKFTATNKKIKITSLSTSQITNSYTISWWSKQNTFSGTMAWGFNDGIRLNGIYNGNLWNTGDSSNNPLYQPGTTTQVSAPSVNVWHHFAMIGDGSTCKVYKDGTLWAQAKTYKGLSGTVIYINGWGADTAYSMSDLTMSDFRIYATALSASDVLELYNTSMIVNSDGTISPRVLTS